MRPALPTVLLLMTGCGYVGDPQPPALHIPMRVEDLSVMQRGAMLRLSFTLPKLTTEGLTITELREAELRMGPAPEGEFQADAWAAAVPRVPADSTEAANGVLTVETKAGDLAGKQTIAMVRISGKSGRWSAWSNIVNFRVIPPLTKPEQLKATGSAAGIVLTWSGNASQYRIARKGEKDPDFANVGQTKEATFTDSTAEFGKPYIYRVTGFQEAGERQAVSEPSNELPVNIEDKFAPAVPVGLAALIGVNSVELAWERNLEKDLRGYRVYRATGTGEWQKIADLVEAPSYGDRMAQSGTAYRYAVTSVDQLGNESEKSPETAVTVP
ncbi:MAG: hypothetical protein JST93_35055 [Acidobacteria bacterium]|nr:hypothetical protein [Acidobacteriota bacterium]